MSWFWTLFSYAITLTITFLLWYFVPNGALFFIVCVPWLWYGIKWSQWHYVVLFLGFILLVGVFIALPYFGEAAIMGSNLWRFYTNVFPDGFLFSWSEYVPAFFWVALSWTISIIIFIRLCLWLVEQWTKRQTKYDLMVFFSHCFTLIFSIYILISLIPSLLFNVDMLAWWRSNEWLSLIYDLFFMWLPFMATFFLTDYVIYKTVRVFQ
jgi:hypothetical protein